MVWLASRASLAMLNLDLVRLRLGQYGVLWLLAFLLSLAACLGAAYGLHMSYVAAANPVLAAAFVAIGLALGAFLVVTIAADEPVFTKVVLVVLALLLALPLFWAPVLGVGGGAWAARVSIEYSSVYAGFRVLVGRLLYDVTGLLFGNPLVDAAFSFMEGFATLVGFLAALGQAWHMLKQISTRPGEAA
jgi:hypothetical protein